MGHFYDQLRKEGYEASLQLAWSDLEALQPSERRLEVQVLDRTVRVYLDDRTIMVDLPENDRFLEIVILHYLNWDLRTRGRSTPWEWALFRQMPGGEAYQAAFQERTVAPLAKEFSDRPMTLVQAAKRLEGRVESFGSATVDIPFLPRMNVRMTVWQGDEEIPGNATILFPKTVPPMLPTEDYAEVGAVTLAALRRASSSIR
jgi:hypothetical protein